MQTNLSTTITSILKYFTTHKKIGIIVLLLLLTKLIPANVIIPVENASQKDWNAKTFWYEPWGASGVHKGIDIFAPKGTPVLASTYGIALYQGTFGNGGKVIMILDRNLYLHYYAHLGESSHSPLFVMQGEEIGAVGTTGNAAGKQPHLHYSVLSLLPRPWKIDNSTQGWKKMFYIDPQSLFNLKN